MQKTIEDAVKEIEEALPLHNEFFVRCDSATDNLIVGNDEWGFCITRNSIDDNLHIQRAKEVFPELLKVIENQKYLRPASKLDALNLLRKSHIQPGIRVTVIGTIVRGVIAERIEDVCLVLRDDSQCPLMRHVEDLEKL